MLLFVLVSGSSSLFRVIKNVNSVPQFFVYRIFSAEIDSIEKSGVNKMKGTIKQGDKEQNATPPPLFFWGGVAFCGLVY